MSRTFRRRNTTKNGMCDLEYYTSEVIRPWNEYTWSGAWVTVFFEKDSKEYKRGKAKFHSDAGTCSFKEPGPSWYRRMFHKMYKSHVRQELHKFMRNPEYEVDLHDSTEKYHMDYWT